MIYNVLFIILGFLLLVAGADILVKGASNIAKKFHIPEMLIGLTIVAIGTSMPEIFITVTSSSKGYTDLIVGNAIGSNLCNLLLILGITSLIYPVKIDKDAKRIHMPVSFLSTLLILFIGNSDLIINKTEGTILLILFAIYFSYPIFIELKDIIETNKEKKSHKESQENKQINVFFCLINIILGVILLKYGSDFVVNSATEIAETFNIGERIIGLTIISIGTALPELITSIIAALKKSTDIAVGNLIGSNVLNLLLILGIGAVINPIAFSQEFNTNLILLAISTILVWLFNFVGKRNAITRPKAFTMIWIFTIYIVRLFIY